MADDTVEVETTLRVRLQLRKDDPFHEFAITLRVRLAEGLELAAETRDTREFFEEHPDHCIEGPFRKIAYALAEHLGARLKDEYIEATLQGRMR